MILIGQKRKKKGTTFVPIFEKSKLFSPQERDIGKISKESILQQIQKLCQTLQLFSQRISHLINYNYKY
jgi:hypothetical protein